MNEITVKPDRFRSRTAVNLVCNATSHAISALIAFFLTPYLTAALGVEVYGFYPIAIEMMAFFSLFSGLLNATATRYVSIEAAGGRMADARGYFSTVFFSNAALAGGLLLPMSAVILLLDRVLNIPAARVGEMRIFFLLMLASVLVDALFAVSSAAYSISGRLDLRAGQGLVGALVKAGVLFLLFSVLPPSIIGIGVAVFASSLAMGLVQLTMSRYLVRELKVSARDFSLARLWQVVSSGFWYTFLRFGTFLLSGAFLFAVNLLYGAREGGVYAVALTVSRVLGGVLLMAAGIFMPVMERHFGKADTAALRDTVVRGQRTVGFCAMVGVSMCVGFCREFFALWVPQINTFSLRLLTVLLVVPALAVASALPILDLSLVMNRMRRLSLLFGGVSLLSLAAAIAAAVFLRADILVVAGISAGVQTLWYAGFLPYFGARLARVSLLTFYLPVLRTYGGAAAAVGLLTLVREVFAVDSWLKFLVMTGVCLAATGAIGALAIFSSPRRKNS